MISFSLIPRNSNYPLGSVKISILFKFKNIFFCCLNLFKVNFNLFFMLISHEHNLSGKLNVKKPEVSYDDNAIL